MKPALQLIESEIKEDNSAGKAKDRLEEMGSELGISLLKLGWLVNKQAKLSDTQAKHVGRIIVDAHRDGKRPNDELMLALATYINTCK
jgi:hypothetical protein